MPTKIRVTVPGAVCHVMARGIDKRAIFQARGAGRRFLDMLAEELPVSGHQCYAWAIMDNHYHLVLRVGSAPLHK